MSFRGLGDEASSELLSDYHATVTAAVETNEGVVLERVGDHALAVFGDAANALRAAGAIREPLAEFTVPAEFGVGISIVVHSGRWSGDPQQPKASTALYWLHTRWPRHPSVRGSVATGLPSPETSRRIEDSRSRLRFQA
jgi:hypothetical protein